MIIGVIMKLSYASYIGIGGYTWSFIHIENDTDIKTNITEHNDTTLEFTVVAKHDLPHNYKWKMALCNISEINYLQYQEEDSQGGFNYSFSENVEFIYLPDEGLPLDWCINTSGYGYVLFSSGSVNQLPLRIRLLFPRNDNMEFHIYTGSSTSIVDGSTVSTSTKLNTEENLVRDSNGTLYTAYISSGLDLWFGNSSSNGTEWDIKELKGAFLNFANPEILINSKNYLFVHYESMSANPVPTLMINSTDYGVTWSSIQYMFLAGSPGEPGEAYPGADDAACVVDKNDVIHCCASWNHTHLHYVNSTGWLNDRVVHQNNKDDTDYCDIAVDSNNNVCIVGFGNMESDLDVFCNKDNWTRHQVDDLTSMLYIYSEWNAPTITCDNDDNFHIAYNDPTGLMGVAYLKHANFTAGNLTNYDTEIIDTQNSYYMDIGISSQKNIWILYATYTDLRSIQKGNLYSANKSYRNDNWQKRELEWKNSSIPSIQDSKYPYSNRMTNTLRYVFTNSTNSVLYNNKSIEYPSCFPEPNKNWRINLEDMCINRVERDITPYNFSTYGDDGYFITFADILTYNAYLDIHGGNVQCKGGFFVVR